MQKFEKKETNISLMKQSKNIKKQKKDQINVNFLKKRRTQQNLPQLNLKIEQLIHDKKEISCPICFDLIIGACTTICGHTYCEHCIQESLLTIPFCPVCRTPLRNQTFSFSKQLDQIVEQYAFQIFNMQSDQKEMNQFHSRQQEYLSRKKLTRIQQFDINMKIDIRDSDYIWCVGTIVKILYKRAKEPKQILVHYESLDEFIPVNSLRLAPLGTYTNRKDLPMHQSNSSNIIQDYLLNFIFNEQTENQRTLRSQDRISIYFSSNDERRTRSQRFELNIISNRNQTQGQNGLIFNQENSNNNQILRNQSFHIIPLRQMRIPYFTSIRENTQPQSQGQRTNLISNLNEDQLIQSQSSDENQEQNQNLQNNNDNL